ncbi:MAG: hypothetical protein KAT58_09745, partial [candidate division Zixibacteria bacterium]|nr:hypothetical protein [candidate division Zixibacteria bacterium]
MAIEIRLGTNKHTGEQCYDTPENLAPPLSVDGFYKNCGDCGQFVSRDRWIRKDNQSGFTHALCSGCLSNYD